MKESKEDNNMISEENMSEENQKKLRSSIFNITKEIKEAKTTGCSGWRSAEECPHNGIFHSDSNACKECCADALESMSPEMTEDL